MDIIEPKIAPFDPPTPKTLSDRERISMIRSAVLIQYTHVTDGRTDGRTDGQADGIGVAYTRYSIYAVERKNGHNFATGLPIDVMFSSRVGFLTELRFLP